MHAGTVARQKWIVTIALTIGLLFFLVSLSEAKPVTELEARGVVDNWLQMEGEHFGESLGEKIVGIHRFRGNDSGNVGYYLVLLDKGWLALPADDQFWPVQVFGSSKMTLDSFIKHPVYQMLCFNQPQDSITWRSGALSDKGEAIDTALNAAAWSYLRKSDRPHNRGITASSDLSRRPLLPSYSDVRVSPFLGPSTFWGQSYPFNYYTHYNYLIREDDRYSQRPAGDEYFPVGCVPLAAAQVAHYHMSNIEALYPQSAPMLRPLSNQGTIQITRNTDGIITTETVNTSFVNLVALYDWNKMNYQGDPRNVANLTAEGNIANLLHDIGILSGVHYEKRVIGVTNGEHDRQGITGGANANPLKELGFSHTKYLSTQDIIHPVTKAKKPQRFLQTNLNDIINTNLDLRLPVTIGVILQKANDANFAKPLGHQLVVDGYAFASYQGGAINYQKPYYHAVTGSSQEEWDSVTQTSGDWIDDGGIWMYTLETSTGSVADDGVVYGATHANSVIYDAFVHFNNFFQKPSSDLFAASSPAVLSGRVLRHSESNAEKFAPVRNAIVNARLDGNNNIFHSVLTDEMGIYAFIVPQKTKVFLEVESPDIYARISHDVREIADDIRNVLPTQVSDRVANRWGLDFKPWDAVGYRTTYGGTSEYNALETIFKNTITHYESSEGPRSVDYGFVTLGEFGDPTYKIPQVPVLFIGCDPTFDYESASTDYKVGALAKVTDYVSKGGILVASGRSDVFVKTLGAPLGITFFSNNSRPRPHGSSQLIENTLRTEMGNAIGASVINSPSLFQMKDHSLIDLAGQGQIMSLGLYMIDAGGTAYWDIYATAAVSGIEFPYGDKGGHVYFFNTELETNYNAGGYPKKFVEHLVKTAFDKYTANSPIRRAGQTSSGANKQVLSTIVAETRNLPRGVTGDAFFHQAGDRRQTIKNESVRKISFGDRILSEDVKILRVDDDLVLAVIGTPDKVTVPGWFTGNRQISEVIFEDGAKFDAAMLARSAIVSEPDVDITPVSFDIRVDGTEGNDTLIGSGANEIFFAGSGNDVIHGGGGSNIFYYRTGDGNDTLIVGKGNDGDRNVLRFDVDIASADVSASRKEGDFLFSVKGGSVRVKGWYEGVWGRLDRVEFHDGTTWDTRDLEKLAAGKPIVEREKFIDLAVPTIEEYLNKESNKANGGEASAEKSSGGGCHTASFVLLGLLAALCATGKKFGKFR